MKSLIAAVTNPIYAISNGVTSLANSVANVCSMAEVTTEVALAEMIDENHDTIKKLGDTKEQRQQALTMLR